MIYVCPFKGCEHRIELPDDHRMRDLTAAYDAHYKAEHDMEALIDAES
jgi:hypothetical protein